MPKHFKFYCTGSPYCDCDTRYVCSGSMKYDFQRVIGLKYFLLCCLYFTILIVSVSLF